MANPAFMIVLRLLHIVAGVFWAGTAIFVAAFLVPSARATGPDGGRLVQHIMQHRRLPIYLGIAMVLTTLSGLTMFWLFSARTGGAWARSPQAITLGVGALLAIAGGIVGAALSAPIGLAIGALADRIQAGNGPPSAEQSAEMARLQQRITVATRTAAALLLGAVVAMAVARYV